MRVVSIFGLGLLAVLFALPAVALTITNGDPDPHTIIVIAGSDRKELTVEPDAAVEPACDQGCIVELDESGEQYEMKGNEKITIEGGVIFLDAVPGIGEEEYPDVEVPDPDAPIPGLGDEPAGEAPQDE